ncbi:hypothetical protein C8J57DRAFT_1481321 [Mycena rebaudengoi]|nr:hypothetical protein C8J57DRAFT_1481321 [Mycena rebaudengoi]
MKVTTQKPTLVNAVDLLDCIGSESWLYNATYQNATRMPPDGKESIDLGWLSKAMSSRFGKGNNGIRRVEEKTTMEVRANSNTHVVIAAYSAHRWNNKKNGIPIYYERRGRSGGVGEGKNAGVKRDGGPDLPASNKYELWTKKNAETHIA